MIWVARKFSRAICMVKNPEVNPENNATTAVPITPMPTVTSTKENAADRRPSWRGEWGTECLIFITTACCGECSLSRSSATGEIRTGHSESALATASLGFYGWFLLLGPALGHFPCLETR